MLPYCLRSRAVMTVSRTRNEPSAFCAYGTAACSTGRSASAEISNCPAAAVEAFSQIGRMNAFCSAIFSKRASDSSGVP